MPDHRARVAAIKRFDQLVTYLRDDMGWPIEGNDFRKTNFDNPPTRSASTPPTRPGVRQPARPSRPAPTRECGREAAAAATRADLAAGRASQKSEPK